MGKYDQNDDMDIDLAAEATPLNEDFTSIFDPLKSGFFWYQPPLASEQSHTTGGHEWNIVGHDMQILTMTVPRGETVTTEVGSFMYMSPFMETQVELTLCSNQTGGCSKGCSRICGGESCVKVFLINNSSQDGYVGLTPNFPAKVVPVRVFFVCACLYIYICVCLFSYLLLVLVCLLLRMLLNIIVKSKQMHSLRMCN